MKLEIQSSTHQRAGSHIKQTLKYLDLECPASKLNSYTSHPVFSILMMAAKQKYSTPEVGTQSRDVGAIHDGAFTIELLPQSMSSTPLPLREQQIYPVNKVLHLTQS